MKKDMAVRQGSAFMKEDAAALKGIAILMMMLHHCFRDASLYDGYVISFAPFPEQTVVRFALILFIIEWILPIPGLNRVLRFLGKHSYNIFLIHTFIRSYYLGGVTYSMKHFLLVVLFLLGSSLVLSIGLEFFKKLVRYNRLENLLIDRITGEKPFSPDRN